MRRLFYLIGLVFCHATAMLASDGENPMLQSDMLRSWVPSKAISISKRDSLDQFFETSNEEPLSYKDPDGEPPNDTSYLKIVSILPETSAYKLFEKCLVTYCKLVMVEKGYVVPLCLKNKLDKFESYPLKSIEEYKEYARFSKGMNSWLPSKDSRIMWIFRQPFSSRWPTIDMYEDIQKIRSHYPIAADYVEYLFKISPVEMNAKNLAYRATEKCKGAVNNVELLTLFALHAFGHGEMQHLTLAKLEAEKLAKSIGVNPASVIYDIMEAHYTNVAPGLIFSDVEEAHLLLSDDDENSW